MTTGKKWPMSDPIKADNWPNITPFLCADKDCWDYAWGTGFSYGVGFGFILAIIIVSLIIWIC